MILENAEEDVGRVLPHQGTGLVAIVPQPAEQALEAHVLQRDRSALHQEAADRGVGVAVAAGIADTQHATVGEPDAG